jgi:NTP pyrophosphatase (non-canonical NTP hydrolase)
MSFQQAQEQVDKWAGQYKVPYWEPLAIVARLAEETGELAREVNHLYGPKQKKSSERTGRLGQEISDIIFTVVCLANREGIDLQLEWDRMMQEKHYGRDSQRYERAKKVKYCP